MPSHPQPVDFAAGYRSAQLDTHLGGKTSHFGNPPRPARKATKRRQVPRKHDAVLLRDVVDFP
jgi:hypothetical protein